MKTILSSLVLGVMIATPSVSYAYFPSQFNYTRPKASTPQYVPDPSLDLLPGWPDWIGRLNTFAEFVYSKKYETLNASQKDVVETLSKNWPDWIGLPLFMQ